MAIDINREEYYKFGILKDQTRQRLQQMNDMGMEEVSYGDFGIKGVMSGLYIEKVWDNSDEDFNSYLDWVREMKTKSMTL